MAKDRLEFQSLLESLIGSRNVYFQPPASLKMNYPAIVYKLANIQNEHADNLPYIQDTSYQVTYITKDPDDPVIKKLASFPKCLYDLYYPADNLNHYVYTIFY